MWFWRCLFFRIRDIFRHKLEIASTIPALNDFKIEAHNSTGPGLIRKLCIQPCTVLTTAAGSNLDLAPGNHVAKTYSCLWRLRCLNIAIKNPDRIQRLCYSCAWSQDRTFTMRTKWRKARMGLSINLRRTISMINKLLRHVLLVSYDIYTQNKVFFTILFDDNNRQ